MLTLTPGSESLEDNTAPSNRDNTVVINIQHLSKMYRIYDRPQDRLKQMLARGRRQYGREFYALRDVSFEVHKGETVGIIGRNGSGKSTLLQIISGTLAPTSGQVDVQGRVAALLELGSGFNPEFTGRENVFLNGAILGFSHEQIEQRFDEIAAFADIGAFIEQPVKLYSSGMLVRLAFAVQACVEPDILIVDEALAVGDVFFQQKCYRRIEELRTQGTTVLLVSHNLSDIRQLCERALFLNNGQIVYQGQAADTVAQYMLQEQTERVSLATEDRSNNQAPSEELPDQVILPAEAAFFDISRVKQVSNGWARCTQVAIVNTTNQPCRLFEQGETARFIYEFELQHNIEVPVGGLDIENDKGIIVHGKNTLQYTYSVPHSVQEFERIRFQQDVELNIATGDYTFEVGVGTISYADYLHRAEYPSSDLYARVARLCHLHAVGHFTVTRRTNAEPVQLLHWGLVDLPGRGKCQRVQKVD